jgi:hypothetical protein
MSIWTVYNGVGDIIEQGENAAAAAHDGNTATYYTLYSPDMGSAPYIIEEDFGQTLTITEFRVYPTLVDEYNWVRVEYWTGTAWALVGYATANNAWNIFRGSWTTNKWRVLWEGDPVFGNVVRVNEMQAVQAGGAQPLIPTWTVYDSAGNIIERGANAAANAHDGDTTTYYTLYSPLIGGAPYIIEEDFGQLLTITQFKVYPTGVGANNWVRVEYWTGSAWSLVGNATTNNAWNTFDGSWTASKWRVVWAGNPLIGGPVNVNEMQAVQEGGAQTLTVSDSGIGTDRITNRALYDLRDVSSGTETATLSNLITITDSGAGAETTAAIPHLVVSDSGWGGETPALIVIIHTTDTGSGAEGLLMDLSVLDESSSSTEQIELTVGLSDTGSGVDGLPLRMIGVLDNGIGLETPTLIVFAPDRGVGSELVIATNQLSVSDNGIGQEKPLRVVHIGSFVFLRPA